VKKESDIDFRKYVSSPEQERLRIEQLAKFRGLAAERNQSLARLALGYVRDLPGVSVALVGASSTRQLGELVSEIPK
jgi:aryl-alcohol dehydrogenase-like predicted oxidoreductase